MLLYISTISGQPDKQSTMMWYSFPAYVQKSAAISWLNGVCNDGFLRV